MTTINNFDTTYNTNVGTYFFNRFADFVLMYDDATFDRILTAKMMGAEGDFIRVGQIYKTLKAPELYSVKSTLSGSRETSVGYEGYDAEGTYQTTAQPFNNDNTTVKPYELLHDISAVTGMNLYDWVDRLTLDLFRVMY